MTGDTDAKVPSQDANESYPDDRHSVSSDDDSNAVEVTFDPSNSYRRKSSLVYNETSKPKLAMPRPIPKPLATQCLVHQLLEDHRNDKLRSPRGDKINGKHEDVAAEVGLDDYVEPKGKDTNHLHVNATATDAESDVSTEAGQIDEKSWKQALKKHSSISHDHHNLNSRLLTKKQLTDMAWGVRELSRRLGSVRLKFQARSIFLLTKAYDQDLIPKTREVAKWLLSKDRDVRYTVYVEENLKNSEDFDAVGLLQEIYQEYADAGLADGNASKSAIDGRLRFWTEKMCHKRPQTFDFVITLGGDGTVLYASWLFQRIVPPVLSFALGSLGFLTKFDFNEYQDILTTAFRDGVTVSLRLRFEGTVMRSQKRDAQLTHNDSADGKKPQHRQKRDLIEELIGEERDDDHTHKPDGTYEILNEIVIDRGPNPSKSYQHQPTSSTNSTC
ncbi:ATP-NAD kinase-domain-containing protein [Hypoxylon sp. FL1150]|nr:ATP-NAD kinase-domain-containing protein [Hypoxylon sp. FL1150]